jgi:hypothetical protein
VSNTRHAKLPAPPPPSPDVVEHGIAQVIGQSVAYHVAQLLAPVLQRIADQQEQPGCIACAATAKRAERAWEVDAANAKAAAEPLPDKPDTRVNQSITIAPRGPVCWSCFDPDGEDGPYDMAQYLPPSVD